MSCKHTGLNGFCDLCEEEQYQRFRTRFMQELGIYLFEDNWLNVKASFQPTSPEPFLHTGQVDPALEVRFISLRNHVDKARETR